MARPQAEVRLGFYPLPPPVTDLLLRHLEAENPDECTVLDPCAGEGVAIHALASGLGIPDDRAYAVELAESRASRIRGTCGEIHLLGPASFHGVECSYNSFSMAYLNPPYTSEIGGGRREELSFLIRALNLTIPGGVVAMVVPEAVVFDWGREAEAMRRTLSCRLADLTLWRPPAEHRRYRELVVLGTKRKNPLPIGEGPLAARDWYDVRETVPVLGSSPKVYRLPSGKHPRIWRKTSFTPAELRRKLACSPLTAMLEGTRAAKAPSPPLPPGRGHVALILASGDLDGLVWPEGEPPHVVRGTAKKISFRDEAKCETKVSDDGGTSTKEVYSERIVLVVRAISSADGTILTFTDGEPIPCGDDGPTGRPK